MMTKCPVFLAVLCCSLAGARAAAQQPEAASFQPAVQASADTLSVSSQPAAGSAGADQDPAFVKELNDLKDRIYGEYRVKRSSTPEDARQFRTRTVKLSIEYYNMLNKKAEIPLIDDDAFQAQKLIYYRAKIAARIFAYELEIYKSTQAYDYKAQAESISGNAAQAEADWNAAIEMAPEAELLRHRGHLYLQQRKYDQAIADFTRAIDAGGGGLAPAYHSRALAYYYKDDYSGAAEDLARFFKVNTDQSYSGSVARSSICTSLRKRGLDVKGCSAKESAESKK